MIFWYDDLLIVKQVGEEGKCPCTLSLLTIQKGELTT